jgi:hypothetical protein
VDRTRESILEAARRLVASSPVGALRVGAVAAAAGVSRITVYNRFGSRAGLIAALAPPHRQFEPGPVEPREDLRLRLARACAYWSAAPALYRNLDGRDLDLADPEAARATEESAPDHHLAERLAAADALRPGCSLKEAEDVIGALTSFAVFDRLHRDGRRSAATVAEILWRLAAGILA